MKNIYPRRAVTLPHCILVNLLLISTLSISFGQTTYYVANSGDDANTGRSGDAPFKTLAKINSLSLQPGDQVLFQRNDTFRGTLQLRQSGSADKPIVIDAYGSGNKPVLAGSALVDNWTNLGNNIWQATCPACGNEVTGLYRNSVALPLGRYPNLSDGNRGYLTIQAHGGKTQLTSQEALSTNWTGGEAVVRPFQWILDRATITGQSGNSLTLNNNSIYDLSDGWGYFIQNHPATLDQFGEWYYNPADKTIRLYDNQDDPNGQRITATAFSDAVNLTNVSFITVRNLKLSETLTAGLTIQESSDVVFSANDVTNSGTDAIYLAGSGSNVLVEANLIEDANNSGVYVGNYQNLTFRGNTLRRIALLPGRGKSGDGGSYTGFYSLAKATMLLENNVLDNIGYNGISVVSNATIRNNVVSNFCLTKSDGSGIYSWNNDLSNPGGLHIIANIVFNGIGAPEGTSGGVYAGANGIFLDDCSQNSEIINNTTFNSRGKGILLRGTSNITLSGNTSFNNGEEQLRLGYNENCTFRNNRIMDNIFFSRLASQLVVDYESKDNDLNQYGQFDNNYYVRPFEDLFKIQSVYNPGSGLTGKVLTLAEWQAQWNQDRNSFNSPLTYKPEFVSQTGASVLNQSFSGSSDGWGVWSPYGNGRVDWDNANRLDGGSLRISFASASNQRGAYLLATVGIGAVTKGKSYQLLFDGVASGDGKRILVYPRQLGGNYSDLAARSGSVLSPGRQAYEVTFTATADEPNAILVVEVEEDGQTAWLDNIQLKEATLTAVNPDDFIKFQYNATGQPITVALNGNYRDVRNKPYSGQLTLAPFSSVVLLKETASTPTPPPTPTPTPAPVGTGIYLSDLTWTSMSNGFGPAEKDHSNGDSGGGDGRTLTLNGATYAKGLGVHAGSELIYNLDGQYSSFTTDMGLDDEMSDPNCGSVEFKIYVDDVLVYGSGVMRANSDTKSATLDVTGKRTLKLVLTDGGDNLNCDHGDWAAARLTRTGSSRLGAPSADDLPNDVTVQVYPLPAQDELRISYPATVAGELSLQLVNITGQSVMVVTQPVVPGENQLRLPVRTLNRGIYVLVMTQNHRRIRRRVLLTE